MRTLLLCILFLLGACHRSDDPAAATPAPTPAAPGTATLQLIVRDANGLLVENAAVDVDGVNQGEVSDADGRCEFTVPTDVQLIVRARKDGFIEQVMPFDVARDAEAFLLSIALMPRAKKLVLADGGEVVGNDGAKVTVPGSAFVDSAGNPITGAVDAYLTPVDTSGPDAKRAFPGRYDGIDSAGVDTPILSLGCVDFTFEQNGKELDLAPGTFATIEIPIFGTQDPDGNPLAAGQQIQLWSLDEIGGSWKQEGVGTVVQSADSPTGWALRGEVGHFSWWNCDYGRPPATITFAVEILRNGTRTPAPNGTTLVVEAEVVGLGPTSLSSTIWRVGSSEPLRIPSDVDVRVSVFAGDVLRGDVTVRVAPNAERRIDILLRPMHASEFPFRPGDHLRGCHDEIAKPHVFPFRAIEGRTLRLRGYPVDTELDPPALTGGLGGRMIVKDDTGKQLAEALFDASALGSIDLALNNSGDYTVEVIADGKIPGCYVITTRLDVTHVAPETGTVYIRGKVLDSDHIELFRAPLTGSLPATSPIRVSAAGVLSLVFDFEVSADHKYIVYEGDPNTRSFHELFVVDASNPGSATRAHEALNIDRDRLWEWGISKAFPEKLVYRLTQASKDQLRMIDLGSPGTSEALYDDSSDAIEEVTEFQFADGGRKVVYRSTDDNSADTTKPDSFLYVVDLADPGNATRLSPLAPNGVGVRDFTVSPDGQSVVFTQRRWDAQLFRSFHDLYRVELNNPGVATLISDPALTENVIEAVFAADNETVVFLDLGHLWMPDPQNAGKVIRLTAPNAAKMFAGTRESPEPFAGHWQISPDSRWLVYRHASGNGSRAGIYLVDLDSPGTPTQIYDGSAGFNITPDSRSIIAVFSDETDAGAQYSALGQVAFNDPMSLTRLTPELSGNRRGVLTGLKGCFEFSEDGKRFYYLADREVNRRYDLKVLELASPLLPSRVFDNFPTGDDGLAAAFALVR